MRNIILYTFLLLLTSCGSKSGYFTPEILGEVSGNMLVSNKVKNSIVLVDTTGNILYSVKFPAPVNGASVSKNNIWVITDGVNGELIKLSKDLKIENRMTLGHTPSTVVAVYDYNNLFVTMRYSGELISIDPNKMTEIFRVKLNVKEPVAMVHVHEYLYIAGNMPSGSAKDFPYSSAISVVRRDGKYLRDMQLPNGSIDVKSMEVDKSGYTIYVTHTLARYQLPTNQIERGWINTNALTMLHCGEFNKGIFATVLLDSPDNGAAGPVSMSFSDNDTLLAVALSGVDEVMIVEMQKLQRERLYFSGKNYLEVPSISKKEDIINDLGFLFGYRKRVPSQGKGPRTVKYVSNVPYVANYYTGDIVNLENGKKISLGKAYNTDKIGRGEAYFSDATLTPQGWQSCASCHPNQARVDGLNWDLLNDGLGNPKNTKSLLFSHTTVPCMISGIRPDAEYAVRSGFKFILFTDIQENVAKDIDVYLKSLRPLESPLLVDGSLSEKAQNGKVVFEREDCGKCHSGDLYTDREMYVIGEDVEFENGWDTPTLCEVWRTAPYLFDGRAETLKDVFSVYKHGINKDISDEDASNLAEYVGSL